MKKTWIVSSFLSIFFHQQIQSCLGMAQAVHSIEGIAESVRTNVTEHVNFSISSIDTDL